MTVKKFEEFTGNPSWEYWECSNCNSIYPAYSPKFMKCRYCGSKDIIQLTKEEYYSKAIDQTEDPEELKDILSHIDDGQSDSDVTVGIRKPHYLTRPDNMNWIGKD